MAVIGTWLSQRLSPGQDSCPKCARDTQHTREARAYAPVLLIWPLFVMPGSAGCRATCQVCGEQTWRSERPSDARPWPVFYRFGGVFLVAAAALVWLGLTLESRHDHASVTEHERAELPAEIQRDIEHSSFVPTAYTEPTEYEQRAAHAFGRELADALRLAPDELSVVTLPARYYDPTRGAQSLRVNVIRLQPASGDAAMLATSIAKAIEQRTAAGDGEIYAVSSRWPGFDVVLQFHTPGGWERLAARSAAEVARGAAAELLGR